MRVFSRTPRNRATLARSAWRLAGRNSTKSALLAPRDSASRPSAPVPANRSRTRAFGRSAASASSRAALTCSAVGRTRESLGDVSCRPANFPATMRTPALRLLLGARRHRRAAPSPGGRGRLRLGALRWVGLEQPHRLGDRALELRVAAGGDVLRPVLDVDVGRHALVLDGELPLAVEEAEARRDHRAPVHEG